MPKIAGGMAVWRWCPSCFLLLILGSTLPANAADSLDNALFQLSLEDLSRVEISTASNTVEQLDRTAATVYVVTEKDIHTFGYRNLADVLDNVPGVEAIHLNGFVLQGGQRGMPGSFSQTLLLINGRQVQNLIGSEAFIGDQFATDNVRQIEIMNSPGSAVHGANAFNGVINILTKDADPDFTGQQARVEAGTQGTQALSLVSATQNERARFSVYLRQYQSDNWDFGKFVGDPVHFSAGQLPVVQQASAMAGENYLASSTARVWAVRLNVGGFYLGTDGYQLQTKKSIEAVMLDYASGQEDRDTGLFYGGWSGALGEGKLTAEYQYRRERVWGQSYLFSNTRWAALIAGGRDPNAPLTPAEINQYFATYYTQKDSPGSQRHKAFVQYEKTVGTSQFMLGVMGQFDDPLGVAYSSTNPSPPFDASLSDSNPLHRPIYRSRYSALYAQWLDSVFNGRVDLTLGGRLDHQSKYGSVHTLRGGLVYHQSSSTHWRLFYGEAFREPTFFEVFGVGSTPPNLNLKPGKIATTELGLVHSMGARQRLQITAFDNMAKELIEPTGVFSFSNTGSAHIQGVESLYKLEVAQWEIDAGYTWMRPRATRVAGQKVDSLNVYKHRVSLGTALNFLPNWSVGLRTNYFGSMQAEDGNPNVSRVLSLPAAVRVDANLRWRSSLLRDKDSEVALAVYNLTNKQFYQPNVRNTGPVEMLQPGRQLLLTATLRY